MQRGYNISFYKKKVIFIVMITLSVSGCADLTTYAAQQRAQQITANQQRCEADGLQPGTRYFYHCMQNLQSTQSYNQAIWNCHNMITPHCTYAVDREACVRRQIRLCEQRAYNEYLYTHNAARADIRLHDYNHYYYHSDGSQ